MVKRKCFTKLSSFLVKNKILDAVSGRLDVESRVSASVFLVGLSFCNDRNRRNIFVKIKLFVTICSFFYHDQCHSDQK
jgi:hypothetical protein